MGSNRKNIYHEDHEEKPNRAQIKTDDTDKWETKRLFTMKVMKISICQGQIDKKEIFNGSLRVLRALRGDRLFDFTLHALHELHGRKDFYLYLFSSG